MHHALFREAWKSADAEVRVAVVMATAAVESGVKHLISTLLPDTSWLLENIPSPPVVKMLGEPFDILPVKCRFEGNSLRPPKPLITNIRKLVECRNRIVHGSSYEEPSDPDLVAWLVSVRDVLWLVDFYCGHEWAANYISSDVVQELKKKY